MLAVSLHLGAIFAVTVLVFGKCSWPALFCQCLCVRKSLRSHLACFLGLLCWFTLLSHSLDPLFWAPQYCSTYFVLCMWQQPVFQSSTEVARGQVNLGTRWSQQLSGIWWVGSFKQETLLLASQRSQGTWERAPGFCPTMEVLGFVCPTTWFVTHLCVPSVCGKLSFRVPPRFQDDRQV